VRFGIVSIFPPAQKALELLRLAERLNFDNLWVCDSHVIWNECYSLLGYLMASSQRPRIQFGTMVTNPVSRDPLVVASAFATLRQLGGDGRVVCGIGRGDSSVRVVRRHPAKVADLEAAFRLIRGLTGGEVVTIDSSTDVVMPWVRGPAIPVYGAAYGQRMLAATGRSADGVIIECADPHYISWALEHIRRAAKDVGRDLSNFAVVSSTATYVSDDVAAAREKVRAFGAVVGNHVAEVLRNTGANSLPRELEAFIQDRPEYDYYKHVHTDSAQANYVPDDVIERLCIVGPLERCAERVEELRAVGVTHLNFYAQTDHYDEHMELYSRHILPAFQTRQGAGQA
jgi:probable F420-dependent oxidoreductase